MAFFISKRKKLLGSGRRVASTQWDNHEDDGFRLSQRGTGNLSLLVGLDEATDFHFELGPERVYNRI
jgi:hypothetical protein